MAFPQTVLPLTVELLLGGTWTSLTALGHVQRRDLVSITRGRGDESSQVNPATCTFTLNNRDGRYSPRNPTGAYYGILGRNTQVRLSLTGPTCYLALDGTASQRITTPDNAALDITGDIDVRVECTLGNWRAGQDLAGKYETTGNQRSWVFYLHSNDTGALSFTWSADGTATLTRTSTVPAPAPSTGRQAVRVTLDVNNGAAGHTVVFYTAPSIDGPWAVLGDPVVTAGTTSIFSSSAVVELGDVEDLVNDAVTGQIHKAQILNGIAGSAVANPDFTIQTAGASSFADAAGRTWTVQNGAAISNKRYRFHGEIASLPPRWDISGNDRWVPVEAAGIMRRLGQGVAVNGSPMYRGLLRDTGGLVAYWPLEDAEGAQQAGAALTTHGGMSYIGTPTFASFETFACSLPILTLNGASLTGAVPSYSVGTQSQVRWLMAVPAAGAENGEVVVMFYTTGTVRRWEVAYGTGGTLNLRGFDGNGTQLFTTGAVAFAVNGQLLRVSVELSQNGANIDYNIVTLEPGASSGLTSSGTLASNTVGKVGTIVLSPGGGIAAIALGHLSMQNVITSIFDLGAQLAGWKNETAGRRVERLCREEGFAFRALGDLDDSARLGPQKPAGFLDLVRAAALADGGMLYEPRDVVGLGYRTRTSLYNQAARLTTAYSASTLAEPLDPVDDDQLTRNDVTISRDNGASARAVQESGALSVLSPPDGVGRTETSETLGVEYDLDLLDQAGWWLHLGTVDESRYPRITVNLARQQIAGDATLTDALRLLEVGDRIVITGPPAGLPPEDISQQVQGYSEQLGNFEHSLVLNCSPESPYHAGVYGTGNLINNGHFETNTTGWVASTNTSIARVTTPVYAGSGALSITRTGAASVHYAEGQDVDGTGTSGDVVTVSAYVRIPAASRPKVTSLEIAAVGIATTTVPGGVPVADTWTRIALTAGLSADVDNVQIRAQVDGTHSNGQVVMYVDAVQVRNVASEDLVDRYQPQASALGEDLTTTETDVDVATSSGPLWTTDDEEFPFDIMIGGERMTVLDISGASSPQTFTVLRSVNGVVKTHTTGANVALFRPSFYGL